MGKKLYLEGRRFERLIAMERRGKRWLCRCDCGNVKEISQGSLMKGKSRSCGCLSREMALARFTKHGMSTKGNRKHVTLQSILSRCYGVTQKAYPDYGGRGITVCDRWRFGEDGLTGQECFWRDMGEKPSPTHSIDRIDNDKGYSPENCRWATKKEQSANRRNNVLLSRHGETKYLAEWARELGISDGALRSRIKRGVPLDEILTKPFRRSPIKKNKGD